MAAYRPCDENARAHATIALANNTQLRPGIVCLSSLALTSVVVDALRAIRTRTELTALMEAVSREMDFRHYALIHHRDLRDPEAGLVDLKDYPAAITDRLIGQHRYRRDPVIRGCIFADARNAGASFREVADIVLGPGAWPGDGEHRKSQVRRLIATLQDLAPRIPLE